MTDLPAAGDPSAAWNAMVEFVSRYADSRDPGRGRAETRAAPVTAAQAQAYAERVFADDAPPGRRAAISLTEFDTGFLVHRGSVGRGRYGMGWTVVDKETGLLSNWPGWSQQAVIDGYNRERAKGWLPDPIRHPGTGEEFRV